MVQLLTFKEIFKERIWGARNLERLYGKKLPKDEVIGESWELADLPEDKSVVDVGPAAGKNIAQLVEEWKTDLLGNISLDGGQFPLLIKLLDANDVLSVQVHPDYDGAKALGGGNIRAKYEGWYVMDAKEGAFLYVGLKPGVGLEQVRQAGL
jgi:mannose-6-phosphate isomerase